MLLVSQNLARELWGSPAAALGKRVRTTDVARWREVIGVVEDIHHSGVDQPAQATVYWPIFGQIPWMPVVPATRFVAYTVRTNQAGTEFLLNEVRQAVWSVDNALPIANPVTMQEILDRSMARTSFTLGCARNRRRDGAGAGFDRNLWSDRIRGVAADARNGNSSGTGSANPGIRNMFVRHGLRLCAIGIVIGVGAAVGLAHVLMKAVLFGVAPIDRLTFAAVPLALLAAAATACYIPARKAWAGRGSRGHAGGVRGMIRSLNGEGRVWSVSFPEVLNRSFDAIGIMVNASRPRK